MIYTIEEVSQILGVCYNTVWKWIKHDKIGYIRFGKGDYRIRQEDLDTFLSTNKKYSGSPECLARYYVNSIYNGNTTLEKMEKQLKDLEAAKNLMDISIYRLKCFIKIIKNKDAEVSMTSA